MNKVDAKEFGYAVYGLGKVYHIALLSDDGDQSLCDGGGAGSFLQSKNGIKTQDKWRDSEVPTPTVMATPPLGMRLCSLCARRSVDTTLRRKK